VVENARNLGVLCNEIQKILVENKPKFALKRTLGSEGAPPKKKKDTYAKKKYFSKYGNGVGGFGI
jgi:SRSO17 transposase